MTELSIVKLFLNKYNYNKYNNIIYSIKNIENEIKRILYTIDNYYKEYKHHDYIAVDELSSYFFINYPSEKSSETYRQLFEKLASLEVSDSVAADVVRQYLEVDVANKILDRVIPVVDGVSSGAILEIPQLIDEYKSSALLVDEVTSPFVEEELDSLIEVANKDHGLRWRLGFMNNNIGPLVGGTLGHFYARPEAGKTSLLASEVTNFATQLKDDEEILWVCNEEEGRRVKFRAVQSMLEMSSAEILAQHKLGNLEELNHRYLQMGGDCIKFMYDPNVTYEQIQEQMEKHNVRLLVVDVADHVGFRGSADLAGPMRLGEIYRRYRGLAAGYNCDVITAAQASADIGGKKVLHLENMHNSKTDKPGALDYAIGMGQSYQPEDDETRWLTISKNKVGCTVETTGTIYFDKQRGRMTDE